MGKKGAALGLFEDSQGDPVTEVDRGSMGNRCGASSLLSQLLRIWRQEHQGFRKVSLGYIESSLGYTDSKER